MFVKREICMLCNQDVDDHRDGILCTPHAPKTNANVYDINVQTVFSVLVSRLWPSITEYKNRIQSNPIDGHNDIPFNTLYRKMIRNIKTQQFISIMLHVDGISICKSKKLTLWLLSGVIIELPPHLRYKRSNMILLSIYLGVSEPEPKSWLNSCFIQLNELKKEGKSFPF